MSQSKRVSRSSRLLLVKVLEAHTAACQGAMSTGRRCLCAPPASVPPTPCACRRERIVMLTSRHSGLLLRCRVLNRCSCLRRTVRRCTPSFSRVSGGTELLGCRGRFGVRQEPALLSVLVSGRDDSRSGSVPSSCFLRGCCVLQEGPPHGQARQH